jgi:hypothetical protein
MATGGERAFGLLLALAATSGSGSALAWGPEGHRVVALIAERHLTPVAHAEVTRLLATEGGSDMAALASWADDFRSTHRQTAPWHFVDIPLAAPGYDAARDCPENKCVVAKTNEFAAVLADRSTRDSKRALALKFLIHLVADLHQPLHAADHQDRGGNEVQVLYRGRWTNLHHLWDSELVLAAGGANAAALAAQLDRAVSPADRATLSAGTPVAWANDTHLQGVSVAYGALPENPGEDLAGAYTTAALPSVEAQLSKAGLRLAALLNDALR